MASASPIPIPQLAPQFIPSTRSTYLYDRRPPHIDSPKPPLMASSPCGHFSMSLPIPSNRAYMHLDPKKFRACGFGIFAFLLIKK
jgi:hypothetical protein